MYIQQPLKLADVTDEDSSVFKALPNGACAFNSASVFFYGNESKTGEIRSIVNQHISDNFEHYKEKTIFPYDRNDGLKDYIEFDESEWDKYCKF